MFIHVFYNTLFYTCIHIKILRFSYYYIFSILLRFSYSYIFSILRFKGTLNELNPEKL